VGDFNTLINEQAFQTKLNREIQEQTDVIIQMDLTDSYRTFPLNKKEYTFFSTHVGTFSKIDHILGHKTILNIFKKIKITPCVLPGHQEYEAGYQQQQKVYKSIEIEHFCNE
jgi:exonuclease III